MGDSQSKVQVDGTTVPVVDGFRQRGVEMTRLETFADAAFAFAVTLLVVAGGDTIPKDFAEMMLAVKQVPAFAASFANIMLFWYAHHRWSRRFGLVGPGATLLTLLLIFVMLIFVYPLKAIYSGAFEFFSGGYLTSYFELRSVADLRTMFIIFGAGYAALAGVVVLLNRHALGKSEALSLNAFERFETVTEVQHWLINMSVPLTSIVLAIVMPDGLVVIAGLCYFLLGVLIPLHGTMRRRAAAKIQVEAQ